MVVRTWHGSEEVGMTWHGSGEVGMTYTFHGLHSSIMITCTNRLSFAEFGPQDYKIFALEVGLQLEGLPI